MYLGDEPDAQRLSDLIFPFQQLERPIQFYQTTLLSQELFRSFRFITKHCVLKSQKSEMHLSPTRQKQTRGRKWANPGMAVEEHDVRHLNCSSASEPKLEKPGRGTESGICGPEDITSTKQCMTGTNHHIASVWITKKRDNVSSNPHQTLYTWLLAPINVIGWVKNKQTNRKPSKEQQRSHTVQGRRSRSSSSVHDLCMIYVHQLCWLLGKYY